MKYLRLLRLQDQHLAFFFAITPAITLKNYLGWIFWWAIAVTCLSIAIFVLNEIVDSQDTDKYSWNPVHINQKDFLNPQIVNLIIAAFSIIGLFIAFAVNLFWWALIYWLLGMLYSLKPIRFKNRFFFDIIVQLTAWITIPYVAPFAHLGLLKNAFIPAITFSSLIWSVIYPYQLADFVADKKAHLKATHIILGMKKSLYLGILFGTFGLLTFFFLQIYKTNSWLWLVVALTVYVLIRYFHWLKLNSLKQQTLSLQNYVKTIKPITYFSIPYALLFLI